MISRLTSALGVLLLLAPAADAQFLFNGQSHPDPIAIFPEDGAPYTVCFDREGLAGDAIEALRNELLANTLKFDLGTPFGSGGGTTTSEYNIVNSWNSVGAPITLTWSLVPDGLFISGSFSPGPSENSSLFAEMDSQFGNNTALWISRYDQAFERWEELTGITFTRVTFNGNEWDDGASFSSAAGNNNRGDIRIAMRTIDGGSNTLAFASFPNDGNIVFDKDEFWNGSQNDRFLRNVIMHETGHSLGLAHVCSNNSSQLMEPFATTSFDGPQHDDLRAVQRNHGDPFEPNNSSGAAYDLGLIAPGTTVDPTTIPSPGISSSRLASIDANGESDWFKFTVAGPSLATVQIRPFGKTYDSSTQNSNGSCNSGNNIDSLSFFDLRVQIRDTNGSTILGDEDSTGAGEIENLNSVLLPAGGTYFVRVTEQNSGGQSQLYRLQLTIEQTIVCTNDGECNDGLFCNGVETCDVGGGVCISAGDPCPGQLCDDVNDICVDCLGDNDCDDGDVCTPPEICVSGDCQPAGFFDDCNTNGIPDECDLAEGFAFDCNANGIPDSCDIDSAFSLDCNSNGIPDDCDIDSGFSGDCNLNDIPDDCEPVSDCNDNNTDDSCDIIEGTSDDFNNNLIPDECEPQVIFYVDDDAANDPGNGDTSVSDPLEDGTVNHPFDAIQEAIDQAKTGDAILLRPGTYTGVGNRSIEFDGRGIQLVSELGPQVTTIDCQGNSRAFNFDDDEGNNAIVRGLTITGASGTAILINEACPTFDNCIIRDNSTSASGGAFAILNSNTAPLTDLRNSIVSGNSATVSGGAISLLNSAINISGSTLVDNSANSGGALTGTLPGLSTIRNSILWDNSAATGDNITIGFESSVSIAFSDVDGGDSAGSIAVGVGSTSFYDSSNINLDPDFTNSGAGDYSLLATSPCIDEGDPSYVSLDNEGDFLNNPRVMDGQIDMGADETHEGMILSQPSPLLVAFKGTYAISNVTPFEFIATLVGFTPGNLPVNGCAMDPLVISDFLPNFIKINIGDANGNTFVKYLTAPNATGVEVLFQALEVGGNCNVSPIISVILP